jgi:hypothetical protein
MTPNEAHKNGKFKRKTWSKSKYILQFICKQLITQISQPI